MTTVARLHPYFADLHVHIGRAGGRPVKMAASRDLTLEAILDACCGRKGIQIVGIVDAVCTPVLAELQTAVDLGSLVPVSGGGLRTPGGEVVVLPGAELEAITAGRPAHYLSYFPDLDRLEAFHAAIRPHVTNLSLSSQRVRLTPDRLLRLTLEHDGLFALAHAFTPHKGYFGHCATTLTEAFTPPLDEAIAAVELGLSADTAMADRLPELHRYPYVTNSDAHSLRTIAREYTVFELASPSFREIAMALRSAEGRRIALNCGLDPRLGKYHVTRCRACNRRVPLRSDLRCPECGGRVTVGVADRLEEVRAAYLAEAGGAATPPEGPPTRPPYRHQTPLDFIPGIGPAALRRLLERFGTEMHVLHHAAPEALAETVGATLAARIVAARRGEIAVDAGEGADTDASGQSQKRRTAYRPAGGHKHVPPRNRR